MAYNFVEHGEITGEEERLLTLEVSDTTIPSDPLPLLVPSSTSRQSPRTVRSSFLTKFGDSLDFPSRRPSDVELAQLANVLPSWLYSAEVGKVFEGYGFTKTAVLLGPAIPLLYWTVILSLLLQVLLLILIQRFAVCDGDTIVFSTYCLLPVAPVLIMRNVVEWRICRHYLVAYVCKARIANQQPFVLLGYVCSPTAWFAIFIIASNLALFDIVTDSMVTGKTLSILACDNNHLDEDLAQQWRLSALYAFTPPTVNILMMASWYLSLVQMVWPLFSTVRRKMLTCSLSHELGNEGNDVTLLGNKVNHDDVLRELADGAGFTTVQSFSIHLICLRIQIAVHEGNIKIGHLLGLASLCRQIIVRILFSWIFENIIQLHLQIEIFALMFTQAGAGYAKTHVQILLSIFLSLVMGICKAFQLNLFFRLTHEVVENHGDILRSNHELTESHHKAFRDHVRTVWICSWVARVCRVVLVISLIYGCCKLGMVYECRSGVGFFMGCVNLQRALRNHTHD